MTITIIRKKQSNNQDDWKSKEQQKYKVDTEAMLKKLFKLCNKIIDYSNDLMDLVGDFKINNDIEEFETKKQQIEQAMDVFCLIMGKKYGLIEAVAKATTIIQKIQTIAENLGVDLKNTQQQEVVETALDEVSIQEMALIIRDLGIESVCEKYNKRAKEYEDIAGTYQDERCYEDGGVNGNNNEKIAYNPEKEEQDFREGIEKCCKAHDGDTFIIDNSDKNK